jgi:hypothetical protein
VKKPKKGKGRLIHRRCYENLVVQCPTDFGEFSAGVHINDVMHQCFFFFFFFFFFNKRVISRLHCRLKFLERFDVFLV